MPGTDDLAEAFRWAEFRTVTKIATVSLHSNTYQVDPSLTGRRVELVFDPFDMTDIAVRHHGQPVGKAIPHTIGRHSHPKARPETVDAPPAPTGIDYLDLVAGTHHEPIRRRPAINFDALTTRHPEPGAPAPATDTRAGPRPADHAATCPPPTRKEVNSERVSSCCNPTTGSPACRSAGTSPPACCTATPATPKPSPGSAGASNEHRHRRHHR